MNSVNEPRGEGIVTWGRQDGTRAVGLSRAFCWSSRFTGQKDQGKVLAFTSNTARMEFLRTTGGWLNLNVSGFRILPFEPPKAWHERPYFIEHVRRIVL
jgi:hypothetical protein